MLDIQLHNLSQLPDALPPRVDDFSCVTPPTLYEPPTFLRVGLVEPSFTEYCPVHRHEYPNVSGVRFYDCPTCRQGYIHGLYTKRQAQPPLAAFAPLPDEERDERGEGLTWAEWSWWGFWTVLACGLAMWLGMAWELWGRGK